jgi:hypothetical protein
MQAEVEREETAHELGLVIAIRAKTEYIPGVSA